MQNKLDNRNTEEAITAESKMSEVMDYSVLLQQYGLEYKKVKHYYQVGHINWSQGWILHISSIISELPSLTRIIIPFLIKKNIPFRIVRNREMARSILNGQYGYVILGKVICIYPTEGQELLIAEALIKLTLTFKGPHILTDRHLGSIIYTRYGACDPVIRLDESGREDEYIYDSKGLLIKDINTIPFSMPENRTWPFGNAITPVPPDHTVLKNIYKPINTLKADAKGNVTKALWLRKFYNLKWCVIKEGKYRMDSDDYARDMFDRLRWQAELLNDLHGLLPVPEVYDFFQENGETYLVIQFIKGVALDIAVTATFDGRIWWQLSLTDRLKLLGFAEQLLDIIDLMHERGYSHGDINPGNFLISRRLKMWVIDLELSFSIKDQRPFPQFLLGTSGFMSPEQESFKLPSFEQDIFSIGCTLICIITGLVPGKFATGDRQSLYKQLDFFVDNNQVVTLLCDCLESNPTARPTIRDLKEGIKHFKQDQAHQNVKNSVQFKIGEISMEILKTAISQSIKALATPTMISKDNLWPSRTIEEDALAYYQSESGSIYGGFGEGLSGTIFLLARAHQAGFSISPCFKGFQKSVDFIRDRYLPQSKQIPGGLYVGTSGFSMALSEGVKSKLVSDELGTMQEIKVYLENKNISGSGIIKGIAGQGISILHCIEMIQDLLLQSIVDELVDKILREQQRDGSWITITDDKKEMIKVTGVGHGVAGVLNFLMDYLRRNENRRDIEESIVKGLRWLISQGSKSDKSIGWYFNNKSKNYSSGLQDGNSGIALTFIKAYELFEQPLYQNVSESVFRRYPVYATSRDVTQASGLTGIGEVYLKASKIFKSEEWLQRADWIVRLLLHHYRQQKDGSIYWLVDQTPFSTAGFMTGNSGIIHFLLNYYQKGSFNHPMS